MAKKQNKKTKKNNPGHSKKNNTLITIVAVVIIIAFGAYFIFSSLLIPKKTGNEYMFKKEGELVIADSSGNSKIRLDIEIADDDYDRQLGLMFRRNMEDHQGMLFIFPFEERQSFWMRNTYIPLDIIFINSGKKIVTIHKNTIPLSDNSYPSSEPAKYVLEVNAGFTNKYNITTGDKISF
ncbi:MAG: DUF192 domain-containing protein [Ignavibacteriaceae bacterium]